MPRWSASLRSPVCHLPLLMNCTTPTRQPRAQPRPITPNAAELLPLPYPVLTRTIDSARHGRWYGAAGRASGTCHCRRRDRMPRARWTSAGGQGGGCSHGSRRGLAGGLMVCGTTSDAGKSTWSPACAGAGPARRAGGAVQGPEHGAQLLRDRRRPRDRPGPGRAGAGRRHRARRGHEPDPAEADRRAREPGGRAGPARRRDDGGRVPRRQAGAAADGARRRWPTCAPASTSCCARAPARRPRSTCSTTTSSTSASPPRRDCRRSWSATSTAAACSPRCTARSRCCRRRYRRLVRGFVINKFRGDPALLFDATADLERRCGVPTLGVLPMLAADVVGLDAEDSLALDGPRPGPARRWPTRSTSPSCASPHLQRHRRRRARPRARGRRAPRALAGRARPARPRRAARHEGHRRRPGVAARRGLAGRHRGQRRRRARHLRRLPDAGRQDRRPRRVRRRRRRGPRLAAGPHGVRRRQGRAPRRRHGYEIHHGRVDGRHRPLARRPGPGHLGARPVRGRRRACRAARGPGRRRGKRFVPAGVSFAAARTARFDALADAVEAHLDLAALERLIEEGRP